MRPEKSSEIGSSKTGATLWYHTSSVACLPRLRRFGVPSRAAEEDRWPGSFLLSFMKPRFYRAARP